MVFPVVMHGCESWTVKKAERRRINPFELWCWIVYYIEIGILNLALSDKMIWDCTIKQDGWKITPLRDVKAFQFSSLSHVRLFATPWIAALQASLSITNSWSSLRLMSIESVMPASHLIFCHPLFLLPPIPPSIRVFSNESTLHMRWPKYWSFSFSISPSNEHPGLISFRMDWFDLLAVQGTLKESASTPQFKTINSSALSFLNSPNLISIHDHWKNHSLD